MLLLVSGVLFEFNEVLFHELQPAVHIFSQGTSHIIATLHTLRHEHANTENDTFMKYFIG